MKRPAVFFDRDNTLIVSDGYLGDPDGVVLVEGAADLVARVRRLGYAAVTFSNQSGVARGLFTEQDVHRVNSRLDEMLLDHEAGAIIDRHEFCPHHPEAVVPRYRQASEFRKPAPGMIYQAARQLGLDLGRSWVVGDAPRDIEAGRAAGCRTILFKDPNLVPSGAANDPPVVEPDFVAASLKEVGDIIENNPPPDESPESVPVAVEAQVQAEVIVAQKDAAGPEPVDAVLPAPLEGAEAPAPAADAKPIAATPQALQSEPFGGPLDETPGAEAAPTQEQEHASAAPVEAVISEGPAPEQSSPPQPVEGQVMDNASESDSAPSNDADDDTTPRRRSPPAVILAAKAAREAARNSVPDASADVLREVARNAARAAAMGVTRDYAAPAPGPASAASADSEPAAAPDIASVEPSERTSQPTPQEPMVETESPRYAEPTASAHQSAVIEQPDGTNALPSVNLSRLEDITEQILIELRQRNDPGADFSVSKLMAGITMVISLALLVYAYLYKNDPTTLQSLLLLGLMLQSITISLLIMGRQK